MSQRFYSQRLDLEFNRPGSFSFLNVTWSGLIIFVISLIASVILWNLHQNNQRDYQQLITSLNQQDKPKKAVVKSVVTALSTNEVNQINSTITVLTTPWDSLLQAIEQSDLPDIALLSVEPNIKKQQVLLTGEAKNLQVALRYIQQLETQPNLSEVYLQKHTMDESDVSKPVRFSALAKWEMAE
ncbi:MULTISPECIES: hypothetical protein [Methylotenera]|uniref:hypothetical protein n=1 Tax=Methylotenera TaxID=359407 RepID=UPI0003784DE8|nr:MULTISPECIES: hypothetical protein [Methylotenera]